MGVNAKDQAAGQAKEIERRDYRKADIMRPGFV
jgi:hypothetical protein